MSRKKMFEDFFEKQAGDHGPKAESRRQNDQQDQTKFSENGAINQQKYQE